MIKVEIISKNFSNQELILKSTISAYHQASKGTGLFDMEISLTTVENNITGDIKKIPQTNSYKAEHAYKVLRGLDETGQHLIIQHYTPAGDRDRVVAIIRDDEKHFNNW